MDIYIIDKYILFVCVCVDVCVCVCVCAFGNVYYR
jgi:hypothetical protein